MIMTHLIIGSCALRLQEKQLVYEHLGFERCSQYETQVFGARDPVLFQYCQGRSKDFLSLYAREFIYYEINALLIFFTILGP